MDKIGKLIRALSDRAKFDVEQMGAVVGKDVVNITRTDLRKLLQQLDVLGKPALPAPKGPTNG